MARILVSNREIEELAELCADAEESGTSRRPGLTYEQGIKATLDWVMGNTDAHPMDEE